MTDCSSCLCFFIPLFTLDHLWEGNGTQWVLSDWFHLCRLPGAILFAVDVAKLWSQECRMSVLVILLFLRYVGSLLQTFPHHHHPLPPHRLPPHQHLAAPGPRGDANALWCLMKKFRETHG